MLKFGKAKNVIARLNNMSKKEAYTWGAIVLVCVVALLVLGSLFGDASDPSFDGMSSRGYDLAQMPFLDDEAEKYLLSSKKYKDMKDNKVSALYTPQEKKERQKEDAAKADDDDDGFPDAAFLGNTGGDTASSSRGGRGYRGRAGSKTVIRQLGSARSGGTGGGGNGLNATWGGNPSGDFSTYNKSQDKGTEAPLTLKNTNARRALSQFAQTSRASAGLKNAKDLNAKRALMGGNIKNSEAFKDSGIEISGGLTTDDLDTNAPTSSADLSNLNDSLSDANDKGRKDYLNKEQSFWAMLGQKLLDVAIDLGKQYVGGLISNSLDVSRSNSQRKNSTDIAYGLSKDNFNTLFEKNQNGQYVLRSGQTRPSWMKEGSSFKNYNDFRSAGRSSEGWGNAYNNNSDIQLGTPSPAKK